MRIDPISLIFIVDNVDAMRILASYQHCCKVKQSEDATWNDVTIDIGKIAQMSMVSADRVKGYIESFKRQSILRPDGTIAPEARKIISQHIFKILNEGKL